MSGNEESGNNGINMGDVNTVVSGVMASIQQTAENLQADSSVLSGLSNIKLGALEAANIAIQDGTVNQTNEAIGVGLGAIAAGLTTLIVAGIPALAAGALIAGFAAGVAATMAYDAYASDGAKQALRELGGLLDTMSSNPDLNYPSLPAWMDGLENMFNDATDTPDPILTLRNIGMRGGDPLILDLNGDGVELVQLENSTARFDVNGDDFATPTGWVNAEDGLLVLDKNSNGNIDNVNELFGNTTLTGFEELALYDSNLDGKINSEDDVFSDLKIWQDRNQDGISQADELTSLDQRQITAINLENTAYSDENASRVTATGSYETAGGETLQVVDSIFEFNATNSQYVGEYELNVDALLLPWMRGSGQVSQLQIAMSKDESLLTLVQDLSQKDSLLSAREAFDQMLFKWAGVEDSTASELNDLYGTVFQQQELYQTAIAGNRGLPVWVMDANAWVSQLQINGNQIQLAGGNALDSQQVMAINKFLGLNIPMLKGDVANNIWNSLSNNLFARFIAQTELNPESIPLDYNYFTDELGFETTSAPELMAKVETLLASGESNSVSEALFLAGLVEGADLYVQFKLGELEANATPELLSSMQSNAFYSTINRQANITQGTSGNDEVSGTSGNDIFSGNAGNDTINSGKGNDVIYGGVGDDQLNGGAGSDDYHFSRGDGNDTIEDYDGSYYGREINKVYLYGIAAEEVSYTTDETGQLTIQLGQNDSIKINDWFKGSRYQIDQLVFEDGSIVTNAQMSSQVFYKGSEENDTITGSNRADNIQGNAGDDVLNGGAGNDSYHFNRGDGNDIITDYDSSYYAREVDRIQLSGIDPKDVSFTTDETGQLTIELGSNDSIKINDWFKNGRNQIEELVFEDGTVITKAQMSSSVATMLEGSAQEDVLTSVEGSQFMNGGDGSDTYHFSIGGGQDFIKDIDLVETGVDVDRLVLGAGIEAENVWFSRKGNLLEMSVLGSDDSVKVVDWFASTNNQLEKIQLDDGMEISAQNVNLLVEAMAAFAPSEQGVISLTEEQQGQINTSISANWTLST